MQKSGQDKKEISLVRLAEDVDVFPRSDLQVKCFIARKKQPGENFVVTQLPSSPCFEDKPGVLLPNAVVKVSKNRHIPWAIANETGRYLHFRKGQVIGTAVEYNEKEVEPNILTLDSEHKEQKEQTKDTPEEKLAAFHLDHIPDEQQKILKDALFRNIDIFVHRDTDLTTTNVTEMRITQEITPNLSATETSAFSLQK